MDPWNSSSLAPMSTKCAVLRRAASPLPHRAQIAADFPEAIMPVED